MVSMEVGEGWGLEWAGEGWGLVRRGGGSRRGGRGESREGRRHYGEMKYRG